MLEPGLPSAASMRGEVLKKSVGSPYVLYPTVAAGLSAFTGALFGFSGVLLAAAGVGAVLACGALVTEFGWRRDQHMKQIILEATKRMEQRRTQVIAELRKELSQSGLKPAQHQVDDFEQKFAIFVDVLDDRFQPGELTFVRYMSVAEQVYLSGLDNIRNAVISAKAIKATDEDELQNRLARLPAGGNDDIERAALTARLDGFRATKAEISSLLVMNEKALAMLDQVTQKLAMTKVEKGMADSDTETAVAELGRLGAMLAKYVTR